MIKHTIYWEAISHQIFVLLDPQKTSKTCRFYKAPLRSWYIMLCNTLFHKIEGTYLGWVIHDIQGTCTRTMGGDNPALLCANCDKSTASSSECPLSGNDQGICISFNYSLTYSVFFSLAKDHTFPQLFSAPSPYYFVILSFFF